MRATKPIGRLLLLLFLLGPLVPARRVDAETCSMGNQCPVADSLVANPGSFSPLQTGDLTATAHDPDGVLTKYDFTATDGKFSNGLATITVVTSATTVTIPWTAPSAAGNVTITVKVWDNGGFMGIPGSGSVSRKSLDVPVVVSNLAPVIDGFVVADDTLFLGEATTLAATAHDPEGDPITWSWSASLGTVSPTGAGAASFLAPGSAGVATITVTATDSQGAFSSSSRTISVSGIAPSAVLAGTMVSPRRVAADAAGNLYVADPALGRLLVLGADGSEKGSFPVPDILSVAIDSLGRPFVGGTNGARLLDRAGSVLVSFDAAEGLTRASDVAVDAADGRYVVLFAEGARVVVFGSGGAKLLAFGGMGDGAGQFRGATGLAVDATGKIFVGDPGHGQIHVFDPSGNWLRSFGGRGTALGELTQLQGVAVGADGEVFVTDTYQSRLQVFSADGTPLDAVGRYGSGLGELEIPAGVAVLPAFGKVAVASMNAASIQIFDLPGAVAVPGNSAPTAPRAVAPQEGDLIAPGSPVVLAGAGSIDLDFEPVHYQFELFDASTSPATFLTHWVVLEDPAHSASIDATTWATAVGVYSWRCRAWDGKAFSAWSPFGTFFVDVAMPNRLPGVPVPDNPVGGVEVSSPTPLLSAWIASDPDGNPLTYEFDLVVRQGSGFLAVASVPGIVPSSDKASWSVPEGLLGPSQEVFWSVRAHDGFAFGAWSATADFRTPPFEIPESGSWGMIPGVDETRPGEVRYRLSPSDRDVPLWFEVYDAAAGELRIEVNGSWTHPIEEQVAGDWSTPIGVTIPASALRPDLPNDIRFVTSSFPDAWGVRNVTTLGFGPPELSATPWNTLVDVTWSVPRLAKPGTKIRLFRALDPGGPWTQIDDVEIDRTILRDGGLTNGTPYYYRAAWLDQFEREGTPSTAVEATPSTAVGVTPVIDLRGRKSGNDLVLSWSPITTEGGFRYYEVYRHTFGAWSPDFVGFSNLLTTVGPFDRTLVVPGGASFPDNEWYSVVPLDFSDARGTP